MTEEISSISEIHLNKKEILEKLNSYQKYHSGNITIIKWEDDLNLDTEMYILKNKSNEHPFLGVVNYEFKREGYCLNTYLNGDEYLGNYSNDVRNRQGLYIYKPKLDRGNKILRQYYFGLWENDIKQGRGIYLWLKEEKRIRNLKNNLSNMLYNPFNNFEKANFDAYIGLFEQNKFTKGTLIKKEENNYFVFHGFFNNSKKNGKNCFYYSAKLEEVLYGTFKDDIFIEGFIGKYNENGELKNLVEYKNKKIKENKDDNNNKEIAIKLVTFRNVIMSKNYFEIIYNIFKEAIDFKNKNMNDVNIFNSDLYIDIMEIAASYNQISIFKDIEKHLKE